jgi:uncharacterized protein (TIGR00730 family)
MRAVCVFCGSNPGRQPAYLETVRELAGVLAEEGIRVVYGGANVGTMGALADGVLQAGGEVVGVVPEQLVGNFETAHQGLSEIHFVESMHERKALMAELADGFIALPGGLGTLEEFAEIVTWSQIGLHNKPTGLLNVAGYYDSLLQFLDHAVEELFLRRQDRELVLSESGIRPLLELMRAWVPRLNRDGRRLSCPPYSRPRVSSACTRRVP